MENQYKQTDGQIYRLIIKYDKNNSVHPHVFLEHYKEDSEGLSSLTTEEKKWVNDRVNRIMNKAQAIYETGAGHNARVTISDFYADGKRLVSEQDATQTDKTVQSSAKVMAALLEGKDVVAQPKDFNLPLHINPHVSDKTINSTFEAIWEKIAEMIASLFGKPQNGRTSAR